MITNLLSVGDVLLDLFGNKIPGELTCFLMSLVPLVELRGGILAAKALGLNMFAAAGICLLGTVIPSPFVLLFGEKILSLLSRTKLVKLIDRINDKMNKKIAKIESYKAFGLLIFVAIPLPGTGAWSGALAAALMKMKFKTALISIIIGSCIADIIMCLISYGVLGMIFG